MEPSLSSRSPFTRRTLIATAVVAAVVIALAAIYHLAYVFLVGFAGILLAVFLDGLAKFVCRHTPLPRNVSVIVVSFLLGGSLVAFFWFAGPRLAREMSELTQRVPEAIAQIQAYLADREWGREVVAQAQDVTVDDVLPSGQAVAGGISRVVRSTTAVLGLALVVIFLGVYLAFSPRLYLRATFHLVPKGRRERASQIFEQLGRALRRWLIGRFASMAVIGVLTAIGLWIAGVPLAFTLGLIAGLLSFVPFIGPIVSAVPGLLIALAADPMLAVWALLVYVIVQILEGNLITPIVQQKVASVPAALVIFAQLISGLLLGMLGVLMATPLTVVAIVVVQMLYVEDTLGDEVEVIGGGDEEDDLGREIVPAGSV